LLGLFFDPEDGGDMFHVISQKTELCITTTVRTSNPTFLERVCMQQNKGKQFMIMIMYCAISYIPLDMNLKYMNINYNKLKNRRAYIYSSGITYHICLMPLRVFFAGGEIYYNLIMGFMGADMGLPRTGIVDFNVCENANTLVWGE
jgi:hypothetical protein